MTFIELMELLGVTKYPEEFKEIYDSIDLADTSFCDVERIKKFNEEFDALGEFLPDVIEGARELTKRPELLAYVNVVCAYLDICTCKAAYDVNFPELDGTPASNMLILIIMLSKINRGIKQYRERGFSDAEIKSLLNDFKVTLNKMKISTGKPGIDKPYYVWLMHYVLCEIFSSGSLLFQLRDMPYKAFLLKNKKTGEHAFLLTYGMYHRSGRVIDSPGYSDTEGAFYADFSETVEAFIGRAVVDGLVSREIKEYKKCEWDTVLKKEDNVISVHIPSGADLSREAVSESYRGAVRIAKERFSDWAPKYFFCHSWMLAPDLKELLGEESKIIKFADDYLRIPAKGSGRDGYGFIFFGYHGPDENLPENTSLQRKVKALYLSGGYTYCAGGFITDNPIN